MTAAACCTSNPIIYQIQVISARSQFTPILPRTTLSSSSSASIISISEIRKPVKLKNAIKSDVNNNNNNNNNNNRQIIKTTVEQIFDLTNDDDVEIVDDIDEEQFLAYVGLRRKTKKSSRSISTLRPLAKRLAAPICLLPLPKYGQRVRQALYILLPFLKFLSITHDIELFCSVNDQAKDECLLTRSVTQTRTLKAISKKTNKRKVSKSEFITMATNTFRNNTRRTPMGQYIHSTLQCHVVLDRLEQSTIDQIMKNSIADNQTNIVSTSNTKRSLQNLSQQENSSFPQAQQSLNQTTTKTTTTRTTITTMTTEKTTVKHKLTTTSYNDSKRFKKASDNDCIDISNNDQPTLTYQRIYLKCFVCSKREYIDAQTTNSDILHSHWLEHGNDLSLNIYDSIIDSILTRVVEFFYFPKRHTLEGKIQTVFILNSKEIRKTSTKSLDDDTCIVLD
ncbi:unnamed protein product [Rotaria sp. Silwood2]|nr:unnamed protein product [Rotaria sp. Silwood2]CAF2744005.1 unnamed protein product [Rotaria sp. Silwood2]CAF4167590.1 unnamed protein product [Rotaria sp. Silwood2]CAF4367200.1 unnamed protein product [Rotaria sp. Silwood2]CAF4415389.1 unnamed protein product [Rotaria sp. Silwood2]